MKSYAKSFEETNIVDGTIVLLLKEGICPSTQRVVMKDGKLQVVVTIEFEAAGADTAKSIADLKTYHEIKRDGRSKKFHIKGFKDIMVKEIGLRELTEIEKEKEMFGFYA